MSEHPSVSSPLSPTTIDTLRSDRAAVENARHAANQAIQAASEALVAGERVDPVTMVVVSAYTVSLDTLAQRLTALADPTPATIAGIDTTLERLARMSVSADTAARLASLRRLVPAAGVTVLDLTLSALDELLARTITDDAPDGSVISSLVGLAELGDLAATGPLDQVDPQRLQRLVTRASAGLPADLLTVPIAVITGQVRVLPEAEPAVEHDEVVNEPVGEVTVAEPTEPPGAGSEAPPDEPHIAAGPVAAEAPAPLAIEQTAVDARRAPVDQEPPNAEVDPAVARLIVERRFGLAAELSRFVGWPGARVAALRIAAYGDVVTSEQGACTIRLRAECAAADLDALAGESVTLHLVVLALVHAALVTGDPAVGAPLPTLAPRLEPHLGVIAEQVGRQALNGALVGGAFRATLADVGALEQGVRTAAEAARQHLRPRTRRFMPTTRIANGWLDERNGMLGKLLRAAAGDRRDQIAEVSAEVERLTHRGELDKEIDRADRRRVESRRLDGRVRRELLTIAEGAVGAASGWLAAVSALRSKTEPKPARAAAEVAQMHHRVREHVGPAMDELADQANRSEGLASAAAAAARDRLAGLAAVLDGTTSSTAPEPSPEWVLTVELLRAVGAAVDTATGAVTLPPGTSVAALLVAVDVDWHGAFEGQVAHEHYATARHLHALAQDGKLPGLDLPFPTDAAQTLAAAEQQSRSELAAVQVELLVRLDRARLEQEVSEDHYDELTRRLAAANPAARADLAAVRAELREAERLLASEREAAAQRLRARLEALLADPSRVPGDESARIGRLIDEGDLATAEELIYFCEIGEPVPEHPRRTDLTPLLTVADRLSDGITGAVVHAARDGGTVAGCPVLDFGRLSRDDRDAAAQALDLWQQAGATPADRRALLDVREHLLPALRLAGYQSAPATKAQAPDLPVSPERRFVDVVELVWNGRALVPQFGSSVREKLRVLLCWGQPEVARFLGWVNQDDPSGDPVLVAYFGTLSSAARRELAVQAVGKQAVAVLDDAALAYLAAHGGRRLDTTMSVLLPFSAVRPYVSKKRSLVASEMFYGREQERADVVTPDGTQVIFGGRGLGKSALLRSAKDTFEQEPGRRVAYLELSSGGIGPDGQCADAVWDMLLQELEAVTVIPSGRARRGDGPYQAVRAGVRQWLAADRQRRLLVLLDEADGFFDADAPRFVETSRLKGLGELPGVEGRAKVVFAGLHTVQRFARVSNNIFTQLARPAAIGPLRPQSAYELITWPAATLGFSFETDDLVHRILGYCSYQPFLLQIFGERLVRHMYDKRANAQGAAGPPYPITRDDVAAVASDPELEAQIRSTFRDTLDLDGRYYVIANVLAQHAYDNGPDTRLSEADLRGDCGYWWPEGFQNMDAETFRSYLQEMVGLGVVAPNTDLRGWRLRSTNILRMIGTKGQVQEQLLEVPAEAAPPQSVQLLMRRPLADGRLGPLAEAQVNDLLGDRSNQVRLVLGSTATGLADVTPALRAVCSDLGDRYELVAVRKSSALPEALTGARAGQRRIVLRDLAAADADAEECLASFTMALTHYPSTPDASRSAVLISSTGQLEFWQQVLADPPVAGFGTVVLRRYDRTSLRVWALDTGRFKTAERQGRLLEVTGGWPVLVEQAAALAAMMDSEDEALVTLARELSRRDEARDLIAKVGLAADHPLAAALDGLIELTGDGGSSREELVVAAETAGHPDPDVAVTTLDTLGIFDRAGPGDYLVEPLLARSWRMVLGRRQLG